MRKIALLTAAFTFALSGVALASTVWYGGATQASDTSSQSGPLGVDIGLSGNGKEVTHLDVKAFLGGSCFVGSVTAHGLKWKLKHGSFSGTKTSHGVKVKISGKGHSYNFTGTYSVTEGSCKSGKIRYVARYETAPNF
jgi:hypothetical protein